MKKLNKLFAILIAVLGVGSLSAQTGIISNGNNLNKQHNFGSVSNHTIPELWCDDARQGFNFSQAVELPNGVYTLSFQMMYRASLTAGTSTNCALYAETSGEVYNEPIKNFADVTGTAESLTGVTNAMNNSADNYKSTIPYFIVTDGRATVGARSLGALTRCTNGYWLIWNPASFKLVSVTDNATLTQALNDLKAEAKTILDAAPASDAKTTLQTAYNNAKATSDGLVALKQAIKAYLPGTGTAANPVDVSSLILSADFSQKAFIVATKNNNGGVSLPELQPVGWTCTDGGYGQYNFFNVVANNATYDGQSNFAYNGKTTGQSLYMRHAWGTADLVAKQTVKLVNGRYKVSVPAIKTGNTATVKYTFAGTTETHNVTTSWAVYEKTFTVNDANNELTIELTYSHPSGGGNRAFFDGVTLLCYGDPIKALLEEICTKADELKGYQSRIPQSIYNGYSTHLTAAANANNTMEESTLQTIVDNLKADITNAESFAVPCDKLQALIDLCTEYTDTKNSNANSPEILSTFQSAIATATSAKSSSTTINAINSAYNTLESARQTYAKNAVPVYPYPFDMTFMLSNTTFDSNIDGWNKTGTANWMSAGKNVECYNNTFDFYTEYSGLNPGSWEVTVDGFYRYGGYNDAESAHNGGTEQLLALLYANVNEVALKSIMEGANKAGNTGATTPGGVKVPNAPADCDAYFATGCYTNTVATIIADGNLKIGIKKTQLQGSDWTIFDNFKLIYKGVDVTELQNALAALIEKAEPIKDKKMGATESTALNTALSNADASVTDADELSAMISALQPAYDNAVVSIAVYEAVPAYIEKANKIDESIAASYQIQYNNGTIEGSAEDVFQNLEINTYNYVMGSFTYPVELSKEWNTEGPVGELSEQHWSGQNSPYLEQSSEAWGSSAWKISYDQDLTLPAGEYVFKVAGRKASGNGCTLSLIVTKEGEELGTVNDFPEGDTGHGITVNGWASFSADSTYANNNVGRGWQWRYVKFTLDSDATVNIAVKAQATTSHQWISFCDATVQMTEETYLKANKGGLDAPTAAANDLVDSKPMGTAENQALNDALDLPVTTGAELLAKIAALEKAVEEANTWREKFYSTRAESKLVEAFERFETDFNDGANGALRKMSNENWTTLLEAVKTAAIAKDVTDNYENFADAAKNFNDAMDAAEFAIANYLIDTNNGDITGLIKNADFTDGINKHNAPNWGTIKSPTEWIFEHSLTGWEQTNVVEDTGVKAFNVWSAGMDTEGAYAELKQTISFLPNGTYRLSADIITNLNADGGSWVAIYAVPLSAEGNPSYENIARSKNVTNIDAYGNYEVYFKVEHNAAVVGVRTDKRFFKIKNIKLEKVEDNATKVDNGILLQKAFENRSATSWDITNFALNASDAEIYLNNPNAIVYANDGQVQWPNTVVDGEAASFTLTEGNTFYSDRNFAATTLSYNRELSDNWLTVCLPFDYAIREGVKVETLSEIDTETKTFTFDEVTETMAANTPYIIKNSTEATTLFASLSDASVKSTPEAMKVTVNRIDAEFVGTYTTKTSTELMEITEEGEEDEKVEVAKYDILFFGTDGQLYYLSHGVTEKAITFKPFRAYIRIPKGKINWTDGQQARVRHRNSEMTDIDTLESADDSQKTTVIYDMHGRRVTEMVKGGMYIVNGKKVVIK